MTEQVEVALIGGPMYDRLYDRLNIFSETYRVRVRIGFLGDHPSLNQRLASVENTAYDLVSTHTKYAPAQTHFLAPLGGVMRKEEMQDFMENAIALATINDALYGLPRNIDVRLLHYRTDLIRVPPATWGDLLNLAREINRPPDVYGFVFPGRSSGLFGTFFELSAMAGAQLLPPGLVPDILNEGGRWALATLRTLYAERLVPPEITRWHYDDVHLFFRSGHAAMVPDWPGFYRIYRDPTQSRIANRFALARCPVGPSRRLFSYAGSHTFALTRRGLENPYAGLLLRFLVDPEQQYLEARAGSVPVRYSVFSRIREESSQAEQARWRLLETVIGDSVLIPPKFDTFPQVEEAVWRTVQQAMVGQIPIDDALSLITEQVRVVVRRSNER